MPVLPNSGYSPFFPFTNPHVQTVFPVVARSRPEIAFTRERVPTPDADFLDLDWSRVGARRLAVICHGLEGNSRRKYVAGAALSLNRHGWDTLNWNFRGCSGTPNLRPRMYHSGVTDDLHTVLQHGLRRGGYTAAALVGFSMGGNQVLKYLGESPELVPEQVKCAAVFSVPCDLAEAAEVMARPGNRIYMRYFLHSLRGKVREKARRFPEIGLDLTGLERIKTFREFDERFTAPLHGFAGAGDYYARASSKQYLRHLRVPTLLVNAQDDPFLAPSCMPLEQARDNENLYLEMPRHGGHVGFVSCKGREYWSESRLAGFFHSIMEREGRPHGAVSL